MFYIKKLLQCINFRVILISANRNGGVKMKNKLSFEKNKGVFTVGRLLIGITIGVVAISMLFTILSFYVEFDSKTLFGSIAQSFVGSQDTYTAKEGWLGIDMTAAFSYSRQIALYSSGDRLLLLALLFFVITKIAKIVTAFEDQQRIFLEKNIQSLRHIGHAILVYMLVAFTYNALCSFSLHMLLNIEFEEAGMTARSATIIDPFFFIYCFVAAGVAYALSGIFQKGLELREDSESFV